MTIQGYIDFLSQHVRLNPRSADATLYVQDGGEVHGLGMGGGRTVVTHDYRPTIDNQSSWEFWEPLFKATGIEVLNHWQLPNHYWPESYVDLRLSNPWWLVETRVGMIRVGWRKKVAVIDWEHTPIRQIITEDDVTKDATMVHCWRTDEGANVKILEYLRTLSRAINTLITAPVEATV